MVLRVGVPVLLLCASLHAQIAIVNSASFRGDQPISPGAWASAFGNFAGVSTTTAPAFPLPKTLAGVRVTVDGVDAAVYDVRSTQITFLIPYATQPGTRPVQIVTGGGTQNGTIRVIPSSPGLFTKDTQNPPHGAVRNQDGVTENSTTARARRGDIISIYRTGPGALDSAAQDGAAPGANPLIRSKSTAGTEGQRRGEEHGGGGSADLAAVRI
jgi:uncharacterized protein (TIGR03437 family)